MSWSEIPRFARLLQPWRWPASPQAAFSRSMPSGQQPLAVPDFRSAQLRSKLRRSRRRRAAESIASASGVRNELIYDLTGGSGGISPTHRLDVKLTATQLQVIVDINTARPDVSNYGIDATYTLTELATGKRVVTGQTFSRVSYNIPGQQQRFAGDRGLRDAENRAAKVIADKSARGWPRILWRGPRSARHLASWRRIERSRHDRHQSLRRRSIHREAGPGLPIVLVFGPDAGPGARAGRRAGARVGRRPERSVRAGAHRRRRARCQSSAAGRGSEYRAAIRRTPRGTGESGARNIVPAVER